jgi:alpha-N-arabinofuranosidase
MTEEGQMKRYLCLLAMGSAAFGALAAIPDSAAAEAPIPPNGSYHATVHITDRVLNTVKSLLFGDNIEWTNDGMGFWLPKEQTFDEKLIEEVLAAGVTHLRYPGGTLSDYFDWSKAIGGQRQPIRGNPFPTRLPRASPKTLALGPPSSWRSAAS